MTTAASAIDEVLEAQSWQTPYPRTDAQIASFPTSSSSIMMG